MCLLSRLRPMRRRSGRPDGLETERKHPGADEAPGMPRPIQASLDNTELAHDRIRASGVPSTSSGFSTGLHLSVAVTRSPVAGWTQP